MTRFACSVSAKMPCDTFVTVEAETKEEAIAKVTAMVADPMFWNWQWEEGATDIAVDVHDDEPFG